MQVACIDINKDAADEVAKQVDGISFKVDVGQKAEIDAAIDATIAKYGA